MTRMRVIGVRPIVEWDGPANRAARLGYQNQRPASEAAPRRVGGACRIPSGPRRSRSRPQGGPVPESPDKPETKARAPKSADKALMEKAKAAKARKEKRRSNKPAGPTPQWYKYLMFTFMVVGLLWIIVFYVTKGQYPVPAF